MSPSKAKGRSGREGRARTAGESTMNATGRILTGLLVMGLVPFVSAQEDAEAPDPLAGVYTDAQGEADAGHDLFRILWSGSDGSVVVDLHGPLSNGSALTAILFEGVEGDEEPSQAYILHHGPGGDRVLLASNGTAPGLTVEFANNSVAFHLDAELDGPCVFAVARTVSYHEGGQTVEDVVGWTGPDIEDAWNGGTACSQGQPVDGPANISDNAVGAPLPAVAWIVVALLAAVAVLRRTQRP